MKVGVGYCDHPDTPTAGIHVINEALRQAGRKAPCDMVLLFSTIRHDPAVLREAVASVIGESVPIYGGGAAGIITNEHFGYAGEQVGAACFWFDKVQCSVLTEGGMNISEEETGKRLGTRLAEQGTKPNSPILLFYDAADASDGLRLLMATPLLAGIAKGLGFPPNLSGIGMIGDHSCNPMDQWIGNTIGRSQAISLAFSGDIQMDTVIVHGCHPATQYFTVTKSDGSVILEIDGEPAIPFIDKILGAAISPEQYPFFLTLGINHGERWTYNEDYYASRLCCGIDKERNGIVMFEPDMTPGIEFQLMYRTLGLDYLKPRIDNVFKELNDREPVFGMYINCAGRSAGYSGADLEEAAVLQQTVAGRVPMLGLYDAVEIAPIGGRSRSLDWTGVFCLFSQSKNGNNVPQAAKTYITWDSKCMPAESKETTLDVMTKICEQNAAKIMALDTASILLRLELEQKRRGFALLAELATLLHRNLGQENILIPVTQRINAALNMQRSVVLKRKADGRYSAIVLQGYSYKEKAALAGISFDVPEELCEPALVTGADSEERLKKFRTLLGLPFFVSSPIMFQNEVFAVLIAGRRHETYPYLLRLNHNDRDIIHALTDCLTAMLTQQQFSVAEKQNRIMIETVPLACLFWNKNGTLIECNQAALALFMMSSRDELLRRFNADFTEELSANFPSAKLNQEIKKAFLTGSAKFEWSYVTAKGEIPTKITLVRVQQGGNFILAGYVEDLRHQGDAAKYIETKNLILAAVNHELRTPLHAIQAMARIAGKTHYHKESHQDIVHHGVQAVGVMTSAIETMLDFSALDSGQVTLNHLPFSPRELITSLVKTVQKEADDKALTLSVSVDSHIPDHVLGDSNRLRQILLHIIKNAVKFTETGGVEIHVYSEHANLVDKIALVFSVKDTGIGIQTEYGSGVFKPLYAQNMSSTRKYGGLGLGLAVSKNLAALMGGEITYESQEGEGSTFFVRVTLPVPQDVVGEKESVQPAGLAALKGMRVLVAEDNRINQMIMKELLSAVGIEVAFAANGINVLEQLRKNEFDLILMDIQMPEMDGLTTTEQIRSDPRFADLPIVAMTANASIEDQKESFRVGMNAHLTKPVNVEELYGALKWWRSGTKEPS